MSKPTKIVVDLSKPKGQRETIVELTDEEIAQREANRVEAEAREAEELKAQQELEAAKASAQEKLSALGLTAQEIEVLTAANVQGYLQDQVVQVYDDATDRSTVLGTAVAEGMVTYLKDQNTVQVYDGTSWVVVTSDPTITSSTATAYTIDSTDAGQYLRFTNAGTVTIANTTNFDPAQNVAIFADGTALTIVGDGNVTLSGDSVSGTAATFDVALQYEVVGIVCIDTDSYRIIGNVNGSV